MKLHQPHLLPANLLLKTGPVDQAAWVSRPVLGRIISMRFPLVQTLLAGMHCKRLLEIGYGSGIFMPELKRHCDELFGIDPHLRACDVEAVLSEKGIRAHLTSGSIESTPYPDAFFDAVVAISSIEFVADLPAACREIRRILAPEGSFIAVTPGHSRLVDFGLRVLTGESAKRDYGNRREALVPTLLDHFTVVKRLHAPRLSAKTFRFYTGLLLRPRRPAS